MLREFTESYYERLNNLYEKKSINSEKLYHLKERGIQLLDTKNDLSCYHLSKILPYIVIGASPTYVQKMSIPYQATSFIAAEVYYKSSGVYAYKILDKKGGGVPLLTGGSRKIGDNIFASLHRILLGSQAIIVTLNNMMENHGQIWSWDFFGNNLLKDYPLLYQELLDLAKKTVVRSKSYFVISIRSIESVEKSNFLSYYNDNKIAMLNPENGLNVIILTNTRVYDYLSRFVKESDLVSYVITGDTFKIGAGFKTLRKKFGIKYLLNDGGRIMSNSMRDEGILGEERVTLEPFNPKTLEYRIDNCCILGKKGVGIDESEVESSILLDSLPIGDEKANVYVYPMNNDKIF
jgi:hypothetical protein